MSVENSNGGSERRAQRRISVGLPIVVRGSDAAGRRYEDSVNSFDLSRTGLSFSTKREIAPGESLEIVIPPCPGPRNTQKEFATLARVVRVQPGEAEGERVVGVQFLGQRLNRVFVSESAQ